MAGSHIFMVDVGVWLLSEKAVKLLMERSGWNSATESFSGGTASFYDLYSQWGLHLGQNPFEPDSEISQLTTAIVPVPEGGFYHFGKSRDIIESVYQLQNLVIDQDQLGALGRQPHPKQFCQNAIFKPLLRQGTNHSLWIENSYIPETWQIASEHVLTGIPQNNWNLSLEPGVCLDFVPIGESDFALRVYGIDDPFRGQVDNPDTIWINRPAANWFESRRLLPSDAGIFDCDIQDAPIFPMLKQDQFDGQFIEWMFSAAPLDSNQMRDKWLNAERLSATDSVQRINLQRLYSSRRNLMEQILPLMAANHSKSIFHKLDLQATAELYAAGSQPLPEPPVPVEGHDPLIVVHDRMFRAAVLRERGDNSSSELEGEAFSLLRKVVVDPVKSESVCPVLNVLDDQIIWGRCPVRLDIAGGWSDTPPYCLERGGQVVNLAVNLNGQPPIQVFARKLDSFELVIRSIDLGIEERLSSYEDIHQYSNLQSGFTIARAAFALAGFDPDFNGKKYSSLQEQLADFGCGIELTMLAAVPKGSGLGTSSILAATLLGTLSEFAKLRWDRFDICRKTMALEQMLTSGGGWQDQIGGVFHGAKLIETTPGLDQNPTMRLLPGRFFSDTGLNDRMLLYYTGITRVAHNILGEIVRGIFLNGQKQLAIIDEIRKNAMLSYDAIQRSDCDAFAESVNRSWILNNRLDAGTNVPAVQEILDKCGDKLQAAKLLGAGGGGYLLMIAGSSENARDIKNILKNDPPNKKARFVDFSLSETGLQITRS
jgi:galactokinase/mevalonate kinase-like predicted kinase